MSRSAWVRLLARVRAQRSVIVCHHGVGSSTALEDPHLLRVRPAAFRSQLELMLAAGFELVTVRELARLAGDGPVPPGYAALSFDDGMQDNHSTALPILQQYGVPATVYVTTGLIGKPNPFMAPSSGARMMTRSELLELDAAGLELGAHTVTHPDLSTLDRRRALQEMAASREALEQLTGSSVDTFAYPFGNYDDSTKAAARAAGFTAAVTLGERGGRDRFELSRANITGKDLTPGFVLKLAAAHDRVFESAPGRALRSATRGTRARLRHRRRAA